VVKDHFDSGTIRKTCPSASPASWMIRPVAAILLKSGGRHGELGARAYTGGLGQWEPPAGCSAGAEPVVMGLGPR